MPSTHETPAPSGLAEVLNQGSFWGRTASSVVAGLTVAYIVGFVATTITVGARGGAGKPVDWLGMLAVLISGTVLAGNLAYVAWAAIETVTGPAQRSQTNLAVPVAWRISTWTIASLGAAAWLYFGPGWWALIPAAATLAAATYSTRTGMRLWAPAGDSLRAPLGRGWAASGLAIGIVSLALTGSTLGVIIRRIIGAS